MLGSLRDIGELMNLATIDAFDDPFGQTIKSDCSGRGEHCGKNHESTLIRRQLLLISIQIHEILRRLPLPIRTPFQKVGAGELLKEKSS